MSTPVAGPMQCARHPKVETGLSCGRCDTPICPKCAVMTDVGVRCPGCAPRRRLPQFEVGPLYLLRGSGAALAAGGALGLAWGVILPGQYGLLGILIGAGLGYGIGESVGLATNRKLAPILQVVAIVGVVLAYLVRNLIWASALVVTDDLYGFIVVATAMFVAIGRLRF